MNVLKYIANHYPGLALVPPLFYQWSPGLRFELGSGETSDPTYIERVVQRAATLYEAAFAPNDITYIVGIYWNRRGRYTLGRHRRPRVNLFSLSRREHLGLPRPAGAKAYWDVDHPVRIQWAEVSPRLVNYQRILHHIARRDFRGVLPDDVFFINTTRNLLFHMYDDRGLDIIATQSATLAPIQAEHGRWLLPKARPPLLRAPFIAASSR